MAYRRLMCEKHSRKRRISIEENKNKYISLVIPHFGPKNTCLNLLSFPSTFSIYCVLLCNLPLCFSCIRHCLCLLNFCIRSYERVFWSFPTKEPIFSPYNLSLSLFNLFAWIICQILFKNHLSLRLSQFGSVWGVLAPGAI